MGARTRRDGTVTAPISQLALRSGSMQAQMVTEAIEPSSGKPCTMRARAGSSRRFCFLARRATVKEVILTREGYENLKEKIEYLSTTKRAEVAERIRIAREFGNIAENAEYDDAKNEQAMLEHQIATLEERMRDARVIEKSEITDDVVSIGSRVRLKDVDANETVEYHIVGSV